MNQEDNKIPIIYWTCSKFIMKLAWIEWLRTIYFALLSASTLNLLLRLPTLKWLSVLLFAISVILFLFGSWSSAEIARRFKRYEKEYDEQRIDEKVAKTSNIFFYEKEVNDELIPLGLKKFQYYALYFFGIIALFLIGISINIEHNNNIEIKETIHKIEINMQKMNSAIQKISIDDTEKKQFKDSLNDMAKMIQKVINERDSLIKINQFLKKKVYAKKHN